MENNKYNEEFKQSIVSLYNSGKSSTQICKEYGMSRTVWIMLSFTVTKAASMFHQLHSLSY